MVESSLANVSWEAMWSPYDEATYQAVINHINQDDIILDIGAGDLRLARRMARICSRVYAIEIQQHILDSCRKESNHPLLDNLFIIQADARYIPFPKGISTGVLLMRHCNHFQLYAEKLKSVGAKRLITNARWRLDVEVVPLQNGRVAYQQLPLGWYACWCGTTGFKSGPVDLITPEISTTITEVINCPHCANHTL
jgi:hypothetical protein